MFELTDEVTPAVAVFVFTLILAASDEDAVRTAVLVFELTLLTMLAVCVFVFELICEVTELEADCTSDKVASDPTFKPAPVSVRVAADHTSVARVPKVERLREPYAQTEAGSEVIILPIDVEAFPTAVFVLVFTPDV